MHHGHMGDAPVLGQAPVEDGRVYKHVLAPLDRLDGAAHDLGHLDHARAVGTVHEHEQLAGRRHEGPDHRLDGEGARSLQGDTDVSVLCARQGDDPLAHLAVHGDEGPVARSPVAQAWRA